MQVTIDKNSFLFGKNKERNMFKVHTLNSYSKAIHICK